MANWKDNWTGLNSILGSSNTLVGGLGTIVEAGLSNAQIKDTSQIEDNINTLNTYSPISYDFDNLAQEWGSFSPIDKLSYKDLRQSTSTKLGNTLNATLAGAMAGSKLGLWGTIGGAIVGLGSGIGGWIAGDTKAANEAKNLNKEIVIANTRAAESLKNRANLIDSENDLLALANYTAEGGPLHTKGAIWNNGIITIGNGGTHEENPYNGVQIGVDAKGIPNMVEEGEVIWNDYVFSNRLKPTKEFKDKHKLKGNTFAELAKSAQKESEERPNDPISKRGLENIMTQLQIEQENHRMKKHNTSNKYAGGGELLRFAPVIGSAIGSVSSLFDTPDYSTAQSIEEAATRASAFTPIKVSPIGTYMKYDPMDLNYYTNNLKAQSGATRRAIVNTSGGNRALATANLLAADYNAQNAYGDLIRKAEEYNQAQKQKVMQYNLGIDAANADRAMQAARFNQAAKKESDELYLKGIMQAAALRDAEDKQLAANRSANLTNLFDNLGGLGKESYIMDMIKDNPALLYDWMGTYKGAKKACGGYLTIKNKKRGK